MEVQTLCRICFETGQFCLNGYEINVQGNNISIEKMMQRFSDIELVDGNAPEMICETCTHDLVQSYLFTEKIQQADARILNLFCSEPEETPLVYEEEVQSQMGPEEEKIVEDLQGNEERFTGDCDDTTDENAESHIVEEFYIDGEYTENDDSISAAAAIKRKHTTTPEVSLTEDVCNLLSNYDTMEEQADQPKRKVYCKKKDKRNKEIHGSGSFVITQFTSSAASKMQMVNMISDDTDEVTLSDIRTMNFETVEVNAGNMNIISEDDQGELPIDDTRVYLCQYCPKAFSSSPFLISHVRKSHGCKYCAKMFSKSTELYKHIREEHATFKCVVCEKDFSSNSNLRNHLKTVHKLKVPANVALLSYTKYDNSNEQEN